jgi:hypothetical protein
MSFHHVLLSAYNISFISENILFEYDVETLIRSMT